MSQEGPLELALHELARALQPLVDAAAENPPGTGIIRLSKEIGFDLTGVLDAGTASAFSTSISSVYGGIVSIVDDPSGFASKILSLVENIASFFNTMQSLNSISASTSELSKRLFEYLIISYLQIQNPILHNLFVFTGIFTYQHVDAVGGQPSYEKKELHWDQLGNLLTNPAGTFTTLYKWGQPDFDSDLILLRLNDVLASIGLPVAFDPGQSAGGAVLGLFLTLTSAGQQSSVGVQVSRLEEAGQLPGLLAVPAGTVTVSFDFPLGDGWLLHVSLSASAKSGYGLALRPPADLTLASLPGQPAIDWKISGGLGIEKTGSGAGKVILFGQAGQTRLEATSFGLSVKVAASSEGGEFAIETDVVGGQLIIVTGEGDSFLKEVLPSDGLEISFDSKIGWSTKKGFYFQGSANLETTIVVHLTLGPIRLDSIYVKLGTLDQNKIGLTIAATAGLDIGVIAASVDKLGLSTVLDPGPPLGLKLKFKPPDAIGLSVDAGVVSGAGYIQLDPDKGEYSGILQLKVDVPTQSIELTIIGLLDTILPGGVPGYSFLLIVTSEFTPIELGFGFTLNGVGGLVGINRTVSIDALKAGLKSHTLDDVLFPPDPIIPRATQIISNIASIFPVAKDRYVFGPILELGWGTPDSIIIAELGILLELPEPVLITILGMLKAGLPNVEDEDLAIIYIQMDILGIIDFEHKQFSLQATIYDSRVVEFQLSGDMAMLVDWSPNPQFILSIGGFHPQFPSPAGFPHLDRLTISLAYGPISLSLKCYFAVTSNSVQAGANLELSASADGFSLHGHLGFDALIIFHPFSFIVEMRAGLDILAGGSVILSVDLDFTLSGPKPWHGQGSASFSILFFSITIPVNFTIGDAADSQPAQQIAVLPLLKAALEDPGSWSTQLLEEVGPLVALAKVPSGSQTLLVHPMGSIVARQKIVPLDTQIDKFGSGSPSDGSSYKISAATVDKAAQTLPDPATIEDNFARGQFQNLNDSDKLSKPSFEEMPSGTELASSDFDLTQPGTNTPIPNQELDLTYDTYYIEDPIFPSTLFIDNYQPAAAVLTASVGLGAAANSPARQTGGTKYLQPGTSPIVTVQPQAYVIASTQDMTVASNLSPFGGTTRTSAEATLQSHLASHPEDRGTYQIVAVQEAIL